MPENLVKWPSGHGKTEKNKPSDGGGENPVPSTMVWGYDSHEPEGYLGNVGYMKHRVKATSDSTSHHSFSARPGGFVVYVNFQRMVRHPVPWAPADFLHDGSR